MGYKAPCNPATCYLSDIIFYPLPRILSFPTTDLPAVPQIHQPLPTSRPGFLISYKSLLKFNYLVRLPMNSIVKIATLHLPKFPLSNLPSMKGSEEK